MLLIRGQRNLVKPLSASAVTLGNFDGFHLGHQALIDCVKTKAATLDVPSVLISFEPQPKEFFAKLQGKKVEVPRLTRFPEKYILAKSYGLDYLYSLKFDKALSILSAEDFVSKILLDQLGVKAIVVGDDFHFGAKRRGDYALLQQLGEQYGFKAIEMPAITIEGQRVSSTRVREALQLGNLSLAERLLGRPFSVWGKVVYGDQRGRDLGFPTANINLHRDLVPVSGVFAVRVVGLDKSYNGVANVGVRPTFDGTRVVLEVHLFDFAGEIYGHNICVEFLHKLREEARYDSFEKLVAQIRQDVLHAQDFFRVL